MPDNNSEKELTLRDFVAMYRRRRTIMLSVCVAIMAVIAVYCAFCTRRYDATGLLQVQKDSSDAMGLDSLMSMSGAADSASGGLDVNIQLQTQASILQSDTLALRAIKDLQLEDNHDYKPPWYPIQWIIDHAVPNGPPDPPGASLDDSPQRRRRLLKIFSDDLDVEPITGTRLIKVDFLNSDPKVAAAVTNKLIESLIDYNFQTRYEATNQASIWLNGQLTDLRKQAEDLQAKVEQLQRESGVYSFGITDAQGREEAYSAVLDRLQETTQALEQAQQSRILKEAIAKAAESGDAEMLSGLAGNAVSAGMNPSLAVIQNLREQEGTQEAALREAEAKYGTAYPKLDELRAAIAGTNQAINQEVTRVAARAKSDYNVALQTEAGIRQRYDNDKKQADQLNDKAIQFVIVKQEADESRQLYEDLLQRLKEAGVLEGLKSSNITIVDPGRVPAKPKKPNVPLYLSVGLLGGLFLGCGGAFVVDVLDNKIHTVTDLEEILGHNVLGVTPDYLRLPEPVRAELNGSSVLALREPHSTYTEAVRAIRTSVLLARGDRPPKVILITSSIEGEGKSTFSANLSTVLAMQDHRVLLVETDMRKGNLRKQFGLSKEPGLSTLLAGQVQQPPIQRVPGFSKLDAIVSGTTPPNPSELLGSEAMQRWLTVWRELYDFVILDGTPILPVTDAVILDSFADMTILLARSRKTERAQFQRSYHTLNNGKRRYIGVVLNAISPRDRGYYGYYGYSGYRKNAYTGKGSHDEA